MPVRVDRKTIEAAWARHGADLLREAGNTPEEMHRIS